MQRFRILSKTPVFNGLGRILESKGPMLTGLGHLDQVRTNFGYTKTKILKNQRSYKEMKLDNNPHEPGYDPTGIQHDGFVYYPRWPEKPDPVFEPAPKLFRVEVIKNMRGTPYWEKDIIEKKFGMYKATSTTARRIGIIKNTPKNNELLYRVKHLVKIVPITFPQGMPKDGETGVLKENGEFILVKNIDIQQAQKDVSDLKKKSLDRETLRNRLYLQFFQRWDILR